MLWFLCEKSKLVIVPILNHECISTISRMSILEKCINVSTMEAIILVLFVCFTVNPDGHLSWFHIRLLYENSNFNVLSQLSGIFYWRWFQPKIYLFSGEGGKAVTIDKKKLSKEERVKFDSDWQKNAFNDYASKMISLHRSLPDVRDTE